MKILITGGGGFIGRNLLDPSPEFGHMFTWARLPARRVNE
jgi:NAD dependent epimerase/dehydratase family enzyme